MDINYVASQFYEIGHPTRLWIVLYLLKEDRAYGSELASMLNKSQPDISQQMKRLKNAGIIKLEQEGFYRYFSINPEAPVIPLLKQLIEKNKLV